MRVSIRTFYILTVSQVFSLIGSKMSSIAIGIWVFNETGNSTPIMLASFFSALPTMLAGSFAGVFADRWSRRYLMIFTDLGQALGTLLLLISFSSQNFELWHLYVISIMNGMLSMFQQPAMDASVTMLVPESHRERANALRMLVGPMAGLIAPALAGFLFALVDVSGIMTIDLITCVGAVLVLTRMTIPQPARHKHDDTTASSFWRELGDGFRFVWQWRLLFWMMLYAAVMNFLLAGPLNLITPYILTLTGSEVTLGILMTVLNISVLGGGLIMSVWRGTRPRIHGIMLGIAVRALFLMVFGIARTPVELGLAMFLMMCTGPLVDVSFMSFMQAKIPPVLQGRVFALLTQMMFFANPLSLFLTGPLVDTLLEPAVGQAGWERVAPLVGAEPGAGMGLLMVIAGGILLVVTLLVYARPDVRNMENSLPDYKSEIS